MGLGACPGPPPERSCRRARLLPEQVFAAVAVEVADQRPGALALPRRGRLPHGAAPARLTPPDAVLGGAGGVPEHVVVAVAVEVAHGRSEPAGDHGVDVGEAAVAVAEGPAVVAAALAVPEDVVAAVGVVVADQPLVVAVVRQWQGGPRSVDQAAVRSEEHTSEL